MILEFTQREIGVCVSRTLLHKPTKTPEQTQLHGATQSAGGSPAGKGYQEVGKYHLVLKVSKSLDSMFPDSKSSNEPGNHVRRPTSLLHSSDTEPSPVAGSPDT